MAGMMTGLVLSPGKVRVESRRVVVRERDTIVERAPAVIVERPVGPEIEVTGCRVDSGDTVRVSVEPVQREYGDGHYRAWVSGIEPRLDSIAIFNEEVAVEMPTVERRESRWGLTVGAGVALTPGGRVGPALTLGVSYRLWPLKK